jgi:hypothetical protein
VVKVGIVCHAHRIHRVQFASISGGPRQRSVGDRIVARYHIRDTSVTLPKLNPTVQESSSFEKFHTLTPALYSPIVGSAFSSDRV